MIKRVVTPPLNLIFKKHFVSLTAVAADGSHAEEGTSSCALPGSVVKAREEILPDDTVRLFVSICSEFH